MTAHAVRIASVPHYGFTDLFFLTDTLLTTLSFMTNLLYKVVRHTVSLSISGW